VAKLNCQTCHQCVYKPYFGQSMAKDYPELQRRKPLPEEIAAAEAAAAEAAAGATPAAPAAAAPTPATPMAKRTPSATTIAALASPDRL